ncbi:hypothetical protein HanRHA438_Chr14g0643461 [Helianthus annuus]|nr:hypothetical protein HanRHA438_Chr14g0643461 [Helianthus annuus]
MQQTIGVLQFHNFKNRKDILICCSFISPTITNEQTNKLTSNRGGTFMEQMTRPRSTRSTLRPDLISGSKVAKGVESVSFDDALVFSKWFFTHLKSIVVFWILCFLLLLQAYCLHIIDETSSSQF